jgi:flagellar hook-associated protein 2
VADRTAVLQQRLIGTEARYRAQFTKLDSMLSSMNNTSTFLTQQIAKMP